MFREKATSAWFYAGLTSQSNWNSECCIFVEGGKPENLEKGERTNNKVNPH